MPKINHILVGPFKTTVVYNSGRMVPYYHDSGCKLPKTVEEFIRTHPEDVYYFEQ